MKQQPKPIHRILAEHFFRRFFDNDTVQPDGDTQTTVIRALCIFAVPGLMLAFFLQGKYPQRTPVDRLCDHYFFVLLSFVATGLAATFEWEMLFPDRLDFLVLTPLPLRPRQMLGMKAVALACFLGLFLLAINVFGMLILPAVTHLPFWHQFFAHAVAVLLAGISAALFFLALGGVLLCLLRPAQFRVVSSIVQTVSVAALVLLVLDDVVFGRWLSLFLQPSPVARWVPTIWYLGLYERLSQGAAASAMSNAMANQALWSTAVAATIVLVTYPLAWARMRRAAFEGSISGQWRPPRILAHLLHTIVRKPGERALFHFIAQTLARNNRYQVYLAMYCGAGLGLAIALGTSFNSVHGKLVPGLSQAGLHGITPLLMFWVIAGMRAAFGLPLNLSAGWIFRVTGARLSDCASAARTWSVLCALSMELLVLIALHAAGWSAKLLFVQGGTAIWLAILLTNLFFFAPEGVPFNIPRMPGKSSLVLFLTVYLAVLPEFVFFMIDIERGIDQKLTRAIGWSIFAAIVCGLILWRRWQSPPPEEDWSEHSGDYLLLGLGSN